MATGGPLKWHGGKSYLAPKIRALLPRHTRYCETHFGGGAVLLAGDGVGVAEFANDVDGRLMNFWWVLQSEQLWPEFFRKCNAVPVSEGAFEWSQLAQNNEIDRALAFFIQNRQSRQALGREFCTPTSRLRRGMNEQVSAWLSAVDGLPEFHARLRRVEIRCLDAREFITELDSPGTCFYCDPPYVPETRTSTGEYAHEMTLDQHAALLECLAGITGKFLLSGYRNPLYDDWAARCRCWRRVEFEVPNQASSKRTKAIKTECVWINY